MNATQTDVTALEGWAQEERACLWSELDNSIRYSANRVWSMGAWGHLVRLVKVTKLVGPEDPGAVPWTMLAGGIYEIVLELAGIERPADLVERMAKYEGVMVAEGYGLSPDEYAMLAETRAAIRAPSEWASIMEELA